MGKRKSTWTPERLEKFRATMAAKKSAEPVLALGSELELSTSEFNKERFKKSFINMFESFDRETRRELLDELIWGDPSDS